MCTQGVLVFTVLDEDLQGLGVAPFGSNRQRSHPVTVSGADFSAVSEEKRQNVAAPHLM